MYIYVYIYICICIYIYIYICIYLSLSRRLCFHRFAVAADRHTVSNALGLFRPAKLSSTWPNQCWGGGPPGKPFGCCRLRFARPHALGVCTFDSLFVSLLVLVSFYFPHLGLSLSLVDLAWTATCLGPVSVSSASCLLLCVLASVTGLPLGKQATLLAIGPCIPPAIRF